MDWFDQSWSWIKNTFGSGDWWQEVGNDIGDGLKSVGNWLFSSPQSVKDGQEVVFNALDDIGSALPQEWKDYFYANFDNRYNTDLANTAYQRAAADMESAGLNPYALMNGGLSPASSPTGSDGGKLLSMLMNLATSAIGGSQALALQAVKNAGYAERPQMSMRTFYDRKGRIEGREVRHYDKP